MWGSIASAVIGGAFSAMGARQQNSANSQRIDTQQDFQERMSSTAHQREVKDLRAAGLNPILSANKGASTPSGALIPAVNEMEPAVSSARQGMRLAEELKLLRADTKLKNAAAELADQNKHKSGTETALTSEAISKMKFDTIAARSAASSAASRAKFDALKTKQAEQYGDSVAGRNLNSVERMLRRLIQELQ